MDQSLANDINHWPSALEPLFVFLSLGIKTWGLRIALAIIVGAMIYRGGKARNAIVHALIAFPLGNFVCDILKKQVPSTRPCVDFPDLLLHGQECLTSSGTASAHAANMAAVAAVMVVRMGWWGSPWVVLAVLTGLSRIYMGVHYPSQVLFGWGVGICAAILVLLVSHLIQTWRQPKESNVAKVAS